MRKKIIVGILLIFLTGLAIATAYFTQNILPRLLKQKITEELSKFTSSNVIVEDVRFNLIKGATISGLVIFEKDDPKKVLMFAKECSASFLIIPFFKENKIIVPSVKLSDAHFHLVRNKDNTLNIGYLIDKIKQTGNSGKTPSLLIKNVQVKNSSLLFTDLAFPAPLSTRLGINNLKINTSWDKAVFQIFCEVSRENDITNLRVRGSYLFPRRLLRAEALADKINFKAYDEYLKLIPVTFEQGQLSGLKMVASFDFDEDKKALRVAMNLNVSDISAQKNNIKVFDKGTEADIALNIPVPKNENTLASCEVALKIKSADISGLPNIDKVSKVAGMIKFRNSDVVFEDLSAMILETPVKTKGNITANVLNLDVTGDFDLKKLLVLVPKDIEIPPHEINGRAGLDLHVFSDFSKGSALIFSGEAGLTNVTLKTGESDLAFETENGRIKFDTKEETLQWHFGSVRYLNEDYSFDGRLKGFKLPAVSAMIIGRDIKVQAELKKEDKLIDFSALKGRFKNVAFDMSGIWDLKENMKASGTILLDLKDAPNLLPESKEVFEKTALSGSCRFDLEIFGPLKDYRLWNVKAKGHGDIIKCYGFTFSGVELNYTQIKNQGFIDSLAFDAYNGKGVIKGRFELSDNSLPYSLRCQLKNIDLNLLKANTPIKGKVLFGLFSMNASLEGLSDNLSSMKGLGELSITNGNIWEFNPFKGLGDFLFIPRFSNIIFTNARGDFLVKDGFIETDNLELLAPELGLLVEGKMSFKGELDLLVNTQIPQPGLAGVEIPGKVDEGVRKAASLTAIKISGTVKDPEYKLQPIGENIMKKLGDIFSTITP